MWGNKMAQDMTFPVSSLHESCCGVQALLSAEISCTYLGSQQGPMPQLTSCASASCSMCDPFFFLTPHYPTCFCMLSNHAPQGRMRKDETVLRWVAGCCEIFTAIHFCSHEPFPWASPGGVKQCLFRVEVSWPRDPACSLLWPERTQGTLLSPGDTRQCACPRQCLCLLLSLCWVSSLGISSSVTPGGEAAPTCRLSRRGVLWGKRLLFPVPPLAQPKAWASPEQGRGKQVEVFGSWVNLEGIS